MVPQTSHLWTAFEHHTLLCLIAKQIQITGIVRPDGSRKFGRGKKFDQARSTKHAHSDVADALNKALTDPGHNTYIPEKEVSAMIDLLCKRENVVKYMERQEVGRITRSMKRVWTRDLKYDPFGGRKGRMDLLRSQERKKARGKSNAIVESIEGVASVWGREGMLSDSVKICERC
jgi:hypothetical protein